MIFGSKNSVMKHLQDESGYTVLLVLIVLSVAAILFTITLSQTSGVRTLATRLEQDAQCKLLAESGIARATWFLSGHEGRNYTWSTDSFVENIPPTGTITLSCGRYGAFVGVTSTGRIATHQYVLRTLFGRTAPKAMESTLTLTGQIGGIVLNNGASVDGKIVMHHGEILTGLQRQYASEYAGRVSEKASPPLPFDIQPLSDVFAAFQSELTTADTIHNLRRGPVLIKDRVDTLLAGKRMLVKGDCIIDGSKIDNYTIIATGSLTIGSQADCKNSRFIAKTILVNGGTTYHCLAYSPRSISIAAGNHDSQFLSGDTVLVGKEATFGLSAAFLCMNTVRDTSFPQIRFAAEGIYSGVAICINNNQRPSTDTNQAIEFGAKSVFTGYVISNGDLRFEQNTIKGKVYGRMLIAIEGNKRYTNYLFGTKIKPMDNSFPFPMLIDKREPAVTVEWF